MQWLNQGDYASKSDVFREGIRKLIHERVHAQVGTIPNTGNSVKEIRAIRKKLSKKKWDVKGLTASNKYSGFKASIYLFAKQAVLSLVTSIVPILLQTAVCMQSKKLIV